MSLHSWFPAKFFAFIENTRETIFEKKIKGFKIILEKN